MKTIDAQHETTRSISGKWFDELSPSEQRSYSRIPEEMDYVSSTKFCSPKAEERFFGEAAGTIEIPQWTAFPDEAEFSKGAKGRKNTLTGKEEAELFLRYNYARYRLSKLIKSQRRRKSVHRARRMVVWHRRVLETRSQLTCANMALVLAMAKRTRIPNVEFTELVSEGNMALLRSIEKFDVDRGFKFSTYSCRAILKSFNRLATKTGRYRQYFPTEYDPDMERSDYDENRHEMQRDESVDSLREILSQNLARLSETERKIVMERFAIGTDNRKGRTLAQVGKMVGLTNERVRQIQNHALDKIRSVLDEDYLVA